MKKRILTVLLAVCLVFALGTVSALAADEGEGTVVAKIGDNEYTSLQDAVNNVENNQTIILQDDYVLESSITINDGEVENKTFTIDLGGKTVSYSGGALMHVKNADVTIENGTLSYTGTSNICAVWVYNDSSFVLASNATIDAGTVGWCLGVDGGAGDVDIRIDGEMNGQHGLTINGTVKESSDVDVIVNGSIEVSGYGLYLAGPGTTTINSGASIIAEVTGIEIRAGVLNVLGGTIEGGETLEVEVEPNSGGTTSSGAGIAVAQHTTELPITVNVSGGTISGAVAFIEDDPQNNNDATHINLNITNGSFTSKDEDYEAVVTHTDDVLTITGGTFLKSDNTKSDVGDYLAPGLDINENGDVVIGDDAVAKVGDTVYTDLQAAFDAATKGQTVVLLKDINADLSTVTSNGAVYVIKTGITFDGNGKKITAINNKQDKVSVQVLGVENVTDAVKITDLVIDGSDEATAGIQAYRSSNVTIDNVDITDCDGAGVIVNAATVTAFDFDTSGNGWGGVNVDNRNYASATFTLKSGNVQSIYTEGTSTTYSSNIVVENGTVGSVFNHANGSGDNNITIKNGNIGSVSDLSTGKTADISVQGGTFGKSVSDYVVSTLPYEAVTAGGTYSYHATAESARNAAGQNGEVNYLRTGTTWDVTLYYDKDVQTKIEVPDDYVFTLPGGTFEGKQIEGWKYGSEVFEPGDRDTITSDRTYYVILRNGQYNIVIDNDIKHGDVSTDVSSADKGATVYIYVDPDIGYVLDDLDVYYGANNRYSVTVSYVRAGVYKFTMPNASVYITATFKYAALPFTDVNRSQWFYDEVFYVYTNGMMEGDSATTFNPDGRMTRAMFWAVLGRIDGATITGNDWAEEARAWAMREGVSDGTNPNDYVTREQMVTMLWRYAGEKNGSASLVRYTDADKISSYAVEAMRWAIGNGIIEGMTSTTLEPQGTATRAQCAAIFMRFDQM